MDDPTEPVSCRTVEAEVVGDARRLEQAIVEFLEKLPLRRKPRDLLISAKQKIAEVAALLDEVDRDYLALVLPRIERPLSACRAEWGALPPGRIAAADSAMSRLQMQSPMLNAMFKGGLEFQDFFHFSDEDLKRASDIGAIFAKSPAGWDDVRRAIAGQKSSIRFDQQNFQLVSQVGRMLLDAGITTPSIS